MAIFVRSHMSITCTGRGGWEGGHCCWIAGKVCYYYDNGCTLRTELGSWDAVHSDHRWKQSEVGQMFAERWPGYGCGDWPQNIPAVMAKGVGLCCWSSD